MPVRYWIKDPSLSEIEPGTFETRTLIAKIAMWLTGFLALALGSLGWWWARSATWIIRNGVPRQVTVTGHIPIPVMINKVPRFLAVWRESDGRQGATRMARLDRLPHIGSTITILVDPQGRRRSVWEGDL